MDYGVIKSIYMSSFVEGVLASWDTLSSIFFHYEPLNFLSIPIHYFSSPLYRFLDLFFHFLTRIKSYYRCAFCASRHGVISIRGGIAQDGPWLL
jgi:hypothetical protein